MVPESEIVRLARDIQKASRIVALSGAGMSIESGIASFRGPGGLWEKYDPEEYGHINTLRYEPAKAWIMLSDMQREILKAQPNKGHYALAELERMGKLCAIITQNVDGLHHVAGNREVIEFHGHLQSVSCMDCGYRVPSAEVDLEKLPPRCAQCGGPVKPDAVFFGEAIPSEALTRSHREASTCDLMLVIGTSAMVYPAASMADIAHDAGAQVVEINPSPTPLTGRISSYIVKGSSGDVLERVVQQLKDWSA
ncbi:MAG: NAD-dependent deacylase [Deltaproteobacteria bacterium]|nr:NAD-dependent deacylase [Deltaproteobacteria bacterium]